MFLFMLGLANAWCRKLEEEETKEEGGEGKEEKEEEEEEEKEQDEEEDEKDEEEEEDEAKRRGEGRGEGEGGGGGILSKISSEETLSKLRLKLNQNKAKSTKHAGRPADFNDVCLIICPTIFVICCIRCHIYPTYITHSQISGCNLLVRTLSLFAGEYGAESRICRWIACFIFMLSSWEMV